MINNQISAQRHEHQVSQTSSGIKVISEYVDYVESISLNILVKIGSRHESPEQNGISHFLEHMAFKGTNSRNAKQIAEEFDAIGGYFNAYTSREATVYMIKALKEDFSTALDILADIFQNSIFDQAEIERERGVIFQEIAQTNDTPDDIVFDIFQNACFPNQAFGRSILGTKETVGNINREDLIHYINRFYNADNIIIAAVGKINHQELVDLLEIKFANIRPESELSFNSATYHPSSHFENKDLEQTQFLIGFQGVNYLDPDFYKLHLLTTIIGGGMSSRLFQEIREKRGLAYSVSAFSNSYIDNGIFGVYAATSEENLCELTDIISEELMKITYKLCEEGELIRAKSQIKAGIIMGGENLGQRVEELSRNYAFCGRYISYNEILENIHNITLEEIRDLSQKIIVAKKPALTILGKHKKYYDYLNVVKKFHS